MARRRRQRRARLDHRPEVVGGGAAASPYDGDAVLADEAGVMPGQLFRRQVVVHPAVDHRRQAGVGQDGDRCGAVLRQVAEVLAHLGRAGGAVEADDVRVQRLERREGGTDLGAHQHPPRRLDRHLHLDGNVAAGLRHGPPATDDGGLGLQQVLHRLDHEEVDAAVEQPFGGQLVAVALLDEPDLAERRDLGSGPE